MRPHISRTSNKDDWETPQELVNKLRPLPTLDAAATEQNRKCANFITPRKDALKVNWVCQSCAYIAWLNPPFSLKEKFLHKVIKEKEQFHTIYVLLPNNARETEWWQKYVNGEANEVWSLTPRVQFEIDGKPHNGAAFGSCLVIYRPTIKGMMFDLPRERVWRWK